MAPRGAAQGPAGPPGGGSPPAGGPSTSGQGAAQQGNNDDDDIEEPEEDMILTLLMMNIKNKMMMMMMVMMNMMKKNKNQLIILMMIVTNMMTYMMTIMMRMMMYVILGSMRMITIIRMLRQIHIKRGNANCWLKKLRNVKLLSPELSTPHQSRVQDTPQQRCSPHIKDQTVTQQIPSMPLEFVHPGSEHTVARKETPQNT